MESTEGIVIIPEGTEVILQESYLEQTGITEVRMPDSVRIIGPAAFCQCSGLRKVRMSAGVTEIGDGAFLGTPFLTSVSFPEGLERIGDMAFWESGLTAVSIPASVREIGESAFWECEDLERADVLGTRTILGTDCFGGCPRLKEGFVAPGYPAEDYGPSNLLFTLLWATCPERHGRETCERAERFIRENGELVLENVLRTGSAAALRGILRRGLFGERILEEGVRRCAEEGLTELGAMFLEARTEDKDREERAEDPFADFEL